MATSIAEVQIRADHLVERARCEADHLTLRARGGGRRASGRRSSWSAWPTTPTRLVADDLGLPTADPEEDPVFSRFMSDDIADEPSREWVIGRA